MKNLLINICLVLFLFLGCSDREKEIKVTTDLTNSGYTNIYNIETGIYGSCHYPENIKMTEFYWSATFKALNRNKQLIDGKICYFQILKNALSTEPYTHEPYTQLLENTFVIEYALE